MSPTLVATLALVLVTAVWGSTFIVVKDAVTRMPVMDFLAWRFGIAALAMIAVQPRAVVRIGQAGRRHGLALGAVLGAGYITQTFGLERTPAAVSGFVTGLFVVFTPLCAAALLRHRVPGSAWVAVVLAGGGLGLLSLRGVAIGSGEALTLVCALAFALHIVGLGEWSTPSDAAGLAVVQLSTVALLCIVIAAPSSLAPPPDAGVWGAILLTSLAATAAAFFLQTWAQAHLHPTRAAVVMTLEPVFAGIFGIAIGGESVGWRFGVGALLVLAAMYAVELGPRPDRGAAGPVPARME